MLTIFYSPHATSVDNEAGRASGHADVPLSARGEQEAKRLGEHYAAQAIDVVFCSDLRRASTTAEIAFAAHRLPIILDARLREFDYGDLTQTPRNEIDLMAHLIEPFPNGESVAAALARVGRFLDDALRIYRGKTIVVIGHSATKYGIEYRVRSGTLADIVRAPWEWRDVPIWRYEIDLSARNPQP